jgi:hypothetical protein
LIKAPPILGPMDFLGAEGSTILIEHDDSFSLKQISFLFEDKNVVVYSATQDIELESKENLILVFTDKISTTCRSIKKSNLDVYVINRIDLFELTLPKKARGGQIKGWVQQLNRVALKDSLVIITSEKQEYKLQEVVSETHNLKKYVI